MLINSECFLGGQRPGELAGTLESCVGKFEVESIVSENALEDSGELGWVVGVESKGSIASDGTHWFAVANYGGNAHGHGFEDREAETFDEGGEDESAGVA